MVTPTIQQAIKACADIEAKPYPYGPNVVRVLRNTRLSLEKQLADQETELRARGI